MKRRILTLPLALLTAMLLVLTASAAEYGVIYTETDALCSDELTELGEHRLPQFTSRYETDLRVDVLTSLGNHQSLEQAAPAIYDSYDYGYGAGANGVSLSVLVHEDEDGVALDEWYLYAAGDNDALTTDGIQLAVEALRESMDAEDWVGDAQQDTQVLVNAINTTVDTLTEFFLSSDASDSFPAAGETIGYMTDTASILLPAEREELERIARSISEKHGFGVYVITVDDFREVVSSNDIYDGATTLYKKYNMGIGDERRGLLFLMSMNERDFSIVTYGDYGNYVFDEVAREELVYAFRDDFSVDNWYNGFADYLTECDFMLAEGPEKVSSGITARVGIIFLVPMIVAAVVIVILGRKMKSIATATQAEAYVGDGLRLSRQYDQFTHATEVRKKRKEESSGGGGGTRSKKSGGFGGTSGKF